MSEPVVKRTVLTVSRTVNCGRVPNATLVLECDNIKITIQPDKLQRYDIAELLHGGGAGTVQLPCQLEQ